MARSVTIEYPKKLNKKSGLTKVITTLAVKIPNELVNFYRPTRAGHYAKKGPDTRNVKTKGRL